MPVLCNCIIPFKKTKFNLSDPVLPRIYVHSDTFIVQINEQKNGENANDNNQRPWPEEAEWIFKAGMAHSIFKIQIVGAVNFQKKL